MITDYKRRLLQISLPIMLSNLIGQIQMMIDRIFLGRLDILYMSAVGNATAPIWTTMSVVFSLGMGSSILVSQSVGEGNLEKAREYTAAMHIFHNVIPILLFFFWTFASPLVFKLMGVGESFRGYCITYTRLYAPVFILTGMGCAMTTMLQTSNNTKPLVFYGLIRSLLNIFLDWVLIFGKFGIPAMGIAGAALGTTIAEYVGGIYIAIVVLKNKNLITKPSVQQVLHAKIKPYLKSIKLGVNTALEDFCWNLGNLAIIRLLNTINDVAAGIYSIVFTVEILAGIVMSGLGSGTVTLTGEATGAKNIKQFRSIVKTAYFWSACISAFTLIVSIIFPKQILSWFTTDSEIINSSALFLILVGCNLFSKSANVIVGNGIRGYGDTRWMFFTQIIGTVGIISIASLFILGFKWGMIGVFVAVLFDEFFRAIINTTRFMRIKF